MVRVAAFCGLTPPADLAQEVICPPYDVVNTAEARKMAEGCPKMFLHVNKPEIDLPADTNPFDDLVYTTGRDNLNAFVEKGWLVRDATPSMYVYEITDGSHTQTGVVGGVFAEDYENDRIKRHELTRPDKEKDRTRLIDTQNANVGPVFLTYKKNDEIKQLTVEVKERKHDLCGSLNGVSHRLWKVPSSELVQKFGDAFERVESLYIADGHHRVAASANVCKMRSKRRLSTGRDRRDSLGESDFSFLAVMFPDNELQILDYNRIVRDLPEGMTVEEFRSRVAENFAVAECGDAEAARPKVKGEIGFLLDGQWCKLTVKPESVKSLVEKQPESKTVEMDVSLLMELVLRPLLGIEDVRTDPRIDFVGGSRGTAGLELRCGMGEDAVAKDEAFRMAFLMFPISVREMIDVSDQKELMPPKSTWLEPKLASGLVVKTL